MEYGEWIGHLFHPRVWVEVINVYRIEVWSEYDFGCGSFKYQLLDLVDHADLFLSLFLGLFLEEVFANGSEYNEGAVYLTDPTGKDIGRGFAEAVQYADTTDNLFRLSGIGDNRELRSLVLKNVSSVAGRLRGLLYLSTHKAELKSVLASAKGMEFFGPPSSGQNASQRHAK
jgi:hypothetical protein